MIVSLPVFRKVSFDNNIINILICWKRSTLSYQKRCILLEVYIAFGGLLLLLTAFYIFLHSYTILLHSRDGDIHFLLIGSICSYCSEAMLKISILFPNADSCHWFTSHICPHLLPHFRDHGGTSGVNQDPANSFIILGSYFWRYISVVVQNFIL